MPLSPKTYSLGLITVAFVSFGAIIAANVLIDPQGVFGTGLVQPHPNPNDRYLRYVAYRKSEAVVTGLFFASSRGGGIPVHELSARTGVHYANFTVSFGLITDHLPMLERVLRDKEASGGHLKQVFLLLDAELLGKRPMTNKSPQTYLPPDITGEDPIRFWIRYLTAIQFAAWKEDLRPARKPKRLTATIRNSGSVAATKAPVVQLAGFGPRPAPPAPPPRSIERIRDRREYQRHLELLRRFTALCRNHGAELIIATAPLHHAVASTLDWQDFTAAVADVTQIAPVWDFGAPPWISERPELWRDHAHFFPELGALMLKRIFDGALPPGGLPFGELRPLSERSAEPQP